MFFFVFSCFEDKIKSFFRVNKLWAGMKLILLCFFCFDLIYFVLISVFAFVCVFVFVFFVFFFFRMLCYCFEWYKSKSVRVRWLVFLSFLMIPVCWEYYFVCLRLYQEQLLRIEYWMLDTMRHPNEIKLWLFYFD